MKRYLAMAGAVLAAALITGAVMAGPQNSLKPPTADRAGGVVSLAEFRQLQTDVKDLKQQVARLQQRLDAMGGPKKSPPPKGMPGGIKGCPQCP